jgi:hypothetical protein
VNIFTLDPISQKVVNKLILSWSLDKQVPILPESPHSRKDREHRFFSAVELALDLHHKVEESDSGSCAAYTCRAVDKGFFLGSLGLDYKKDENSHENLKFVEFVRNSVVGPT